MYRAPTSHASLSVTALIALAAAAVVTACSPRVNRELAASPVADAVYAAGQVATAVSVLPGSTAPTYPTSLRDAKTTGEVLVEFVVDTTGLVDVESFKVIKASDPLFANAVKVALPGFRFSPALLASGQRVKQRVVSPFAFELR
jgi:TonB family protein